MRNLKKLSWQIPFLLFLILGTYYVLSTNTEKQLPRNEQPEAGDKQNESVQDSTCRMEHTDDSRLKSN